MAKSNIRRVRHIYLPKKRDALMIQGDVMTNLIHKVVCHNNNEATIIISIQGKEATRECFVAILYALMTSLHIKSKRIQA